MIQVERNFEKMLFWGPDNFSLAGSLLPTSQLRHESLRAEVDSKRCESLRTVVFHSLRPVGPNNNLASLANPISFRALSPVKSLPNTRHENSLFIHDEVVGGVQKGSCTWLWHAGQVKYLFLSVCTTTQLAWLLGSFRIKRRAALPCTKWKKLVSSLL